jgi:hypothetical protein
MKSLPRTLFPILAMLGLAGCPNEQDLSGFADSEGAGSNGGHADASQPTPDGGGPDGTTTPITQPPDSAPFATQDDAASPTGQPDAPPTKVDANPVVPDTAPVSVDTRPSTPDTAAVPVDTRPVTVDTAPVKTDTASVGVADAPPAAINCTPGSARTFDVGPGHTYTKVGDVPWYDLGPGDTVRIFWRAEPYREKILISNRGTADQPIRLCGVVGPAGELPVLSGQNATSGPNLHFVNYAPIQDEALLLISRDASDPYFSRPGYVTIDGLTLRDAYRDYSYTATDGSVRKFMNASSSIAILGGDHITIRNCELSNSGMGLFTLSKDEDENTLVRDVLMEGCHLFGNGNADSWLEHNVYAQTIGVTIQFNKFGRLRSGALGANIKDRSAGTVIRYNYVEGTVRLLDLVDAQDHVNFAKADPRYRQTFVYGNVLISGPQDAAALIHYGGDTTGFEQNFRKGTLYLYNNTVIESANQADMWNTTLVNADTMDEHVDMRNNIIWSKGTTNFHLLGLAGQATIGPNWISTGYVPAMEGGNATVSIGSGIITGTDPKLDPTTLRPMDGCTAIDKGVALAAPAADQYPCSSEYAPESSGTNRVTKGAASDFGAFEAAR